MNIPFDLNHSPSKHPLSIQTAHVLFSFLKPHTLTPTIILIQYLPDQDLVLLPPSGKLISTLYQTTNNNNNNNLGYVNVTHDGQTNTTTVRSSVAFSQQPNTATILKTLVNINNIKNINSPSSVIIYSVTSLIFPYGLDILASETRPGSGLNITKVLIDGHNFNVAASMLAASGVVQEFESYEGRAGITLFVPTDDAFAELPSTANFQSLPADKKADVLRYHVSYSYYYPLGSCR